MKNVLFILFLSLGLTAMSQETYILSPESKLTINGSSTIHDWTVTANTIQGSINGASNTLNEVSFEVTVEDIKSERGAAMDKKMHEALKKEEHPQVTFTLKTPAELGGEQAALSGTLTIAGVEKEVTIDAKSDTSDGKIQLSGSKGLKLSDFNMEPPTAMFGSIVVGEDVTVNFDLIFSKN